MDTILYILKIDTDVSTEILGIYDSRKLAEDSMKRFKNSTCPKLSPYIESMRLNDDEWREYY